MRQRFSFCFDDVPYPWSVDHITTVDGSVYINGDTCKAWVSAYTLEEAQAKVSELCEIDFAELPSQVNHMHTNLPAYDGPLKAT